MPMSKYDDRYEFNERKWVVTLINTKKGIEGVFGGHAKIVVEGVQAARNGSPVGSQLFFGEYHIMEAEHVLKESWIPQAFRNTKCAYSVIFREPHNYDLPDEKYAEISSKSWIASANLAREMITNIKNEECEINTGKKISKFQYAGNYCLYSYKGGHNCTSWAEEKLALVEVGNGFLPADSSKSMPWIHTKCNII